MRLGQGAIVARRRCGRLVRVRARVRAGVRVGVRVGVGVRVRVRVRAPRRPASAAH